MGTGPGREIARKSRAGAAAATRSMATAVMVPHLSALSKISKRAGL